MVVIIRVQLVREVNTKRSLIRSPIQGPVVSGSNDPVVTDSIPVEHPVKDETAPRFHVLLGGGW